MVCKGCGTSKLLEYIINPIWVISQWILSNETLISRLQVHGHQVRRQLCLQQGLQVRLQEWTQGSVLQDQVDEGAQI